MKTEEKYIKAIKTTLDQDIEDHEKIEVINSITAEYRKNKFESAQTKAKDLIGSEAPEVSE